MLQFDAKIKKCYLPEKEWTLSFSCCDNNLNFMKHDLVFNNIKSERKESAGTVLGTYETKILLSWSLQEWKDR